MLVPFLVLTAALAQPPTANYVAVTATETKTGPWRSLGKNWAATLGDGTAPLANLISLRKADTPLPEWPRTAGVILANGDRIAGTVLTGDDTALVLKTAWQPKGLRVPLPAIRVLWLTAIPADAPAFVDRYRWLDPKRKSDVVLLRNGDTAAGDIEKFADAGAVRLRHGTEAIATFEATAMAAVAFNPNLSATRKLKGPFARLVLADGSRITVSAATADGTTLRATTTFGAAFEVALNQVIALDVQQGKATDLADLRPKSEKVEPFNDLAWPWQANRTVKSRPLRLATPRGVSTFDTGLGTHPHTTLTYSLNGKYRRFTALVGLDADTGRRGAAKVQILVDGKDQPLDGLAKLSAAAGQVPVSVELAGAKELTLVVDFGAGGDVQADVNWADARLIE